MQYGLGFMLSGSTPNTSHLSLHIHHPQDAAPTCRLPAGKRRSENEVVVIGFSPVLVGIMCRLEVYLPAAVQQLLPEDRPQREPFSYFQLSGVEGYFEGCNEVPLGDAPVSACLVRRFSAGDGDRCELWPFALQQVSDGHAYPGVFHHEGGRLGGVSPP